MISGVLEFGGGGGDGGGELPLLPMKRRDAKVNFHIRGTNWVKVSNRLFLPIADSFSRFIDIFMVFFMRFTRKKKN